MKARRARKPGEVTFELSRRDEPLMDAATLTAVKSPLKIKRILVPVDFSDCSKKALAYAVPLAREHQAAISLVSVVVPAYAGAEYGGLDYSQFDADMLAAARKELTRIAGQQTAAGVDTEPIVTMGSPAREIIETARQLPADLIIISTHGRTGLGHVFLGSVAEHVVQRAPCPVLVVREHEHEIIAS